MTDPIHLIRNTFVQVWGIEQAVFFEQGEGPVDEAPPGPAQTHEKQHRVMQ